MVQKNLYTKITKFGNIAHKAKSKKPTLSACFLSWN